MTLICSGTTFKVLGFCNEKWERYNINEAIPVIFMLQKFSVQKFGDGVKLPNLVLCEDWFWFHCKLLGYLVHDNHAFIWYFMIVKSDKRPFYYGLKFYYGPKNELSPHLLL